MPPEPARWLTPPAPAAIAVLRCPPLAALLDVSLPSRERACFGRLLDAAGCVVDEVVALRDEADALLLCPHGGPGIRAAVEAALLGHGIALAELPLAADRWSRLARCPSPAARDWLLTAGEEPPSFPEVFLERLPLVLITGPPNAGKSSLLNAWCGHRRAVVSAQAGTTRDLVAAEVLHRGWRLRVLDSAGLRAGADDELERAGQDLVAEVRSRADLVIHLSPCDAPEAAPADCLPVHGKLDLAPEPPAGLAWAVGERLGAAAAEARLAALGDAVLARLGLPPA